MIVTVSQVVIIGGKRIEKSATAQIHSLVGEAVLTPAGLKPGSAIVFLDEQIAEAARSLFRSLQEDPK